MVVFSYIEGRPSKGEGETESGGGGKDTGSGSGGEGKGETGAGGSGKPSEKLNWDAIVSKKGQTRVDHINRHAVPNNSRETHGVLMEIL